MESLKPPTSGTPTLAKKDMEAVTPSTTPYETGDGEHQTEFQQF